MNRSMFALAVLALCSTAAAGCRRAADAPEPQPAALDACTAALAPGGQDTAIDHAIEQAQGRARGRARTKDALERLGYLYVARARVAHDAGDYKLAEMAADCLALRYPDAPAALLLRGHVLHQQHRFAEAEQMARALVARREVSLDYGLLGDALMEQGRLDEAAAAYQKMIDLKPFYQSYTRAAHLRWLKGDLDGAIAADAAGGRCGEPSGSGIGGVGVDAAVACTSCRRGRLARHCAAGDAALRLAARLRRGAPGARAGPHRDATARRTPSQALERAARLNPLPEYQWALADALRLQGRTDEARTGRARARRAAALPPIRERSRSTWRPAEPTTAMAVRLTRRGAALAARRVHPRRARVGARRERPHRRSAAALMSRALAEGTEDARLFLHAGVIAAAAGERAEARKWLTKAEPCERCSCRPNLRSSAATADRNPSNEENRNEDH